MSHILITEANLWLDRKDYCPYCKKDTVSGMQEYYDDLFCKDCNKIKGRIA